MGADNVRALFSGGGGGRPEACPRTSLKFGVLAMPFPAFPVLNLGNIKVVKYSKI